MNFKNFVRFILACLFLCGSILNAENIPPSPPARLAGYVYLNGQLLRNPQGYSLRVEIGKTEIERRIDSQGCYSLLIPDDVGVRTGDRIEIILYQNERPVSSANWVNVPDFGTMKIVHLRY